ncbi:Ig-like domain-containing protein [Rhodococcus hoagii]|nr:Ig-like domain-containing protein [Prescottella equi]
MTTMHYSGSLGSGTYQDKGPTISVLKTTTTSLASVATPMLTGQAVTLTATVTNGAQGNPVEFYDGSTKLGEGTLNAVGVGTFVWTPTTVGARSLTAKFPRTTLANVSQSAAQNVQVTAPVSTGVSVTAPGTAVTGTPVTLSASVTPPNAAGTVQFKDNGTNIGNPVTVAGGQAILPHTFTTTGVHSITADFIAGSGFVNSSAPAQTVTVNAPTSTTLQAPTSATTGTPVTLSASVTPTNAAGTVQFKDNGTDIGTPVAVASGAASLPHTFTTGGAHAITAVFTGNAGFAGSTAPAQTVNVSVPDVATSTTLTVPQTAQTNQSVTLSATVAPTPTSGTVQFKDGSTNIGAPVALVNGVATLPHSFASAGSPSITAEFSGSTGFASSVSAAQSVTVTEPDVETSLSVTAPASATTGSSVDLTATVSPSGAQGTVQFKVNGSPVGAPQTVSGGAASLPYTFNAAGSFAVTAEFAGAAGFTNATAAAQAVTVSVPDAVTSLTLDVPATAVTGTSVNLTAAVSPSGAQGAVQFTDGGTPIGAPVPVVNGVATLPYTFSGSGSHSIGASFTGAPGFADASATSPGSIEVSDPDQQTTTTVSVPATAQTGTAVTLEATVAPVPTGGTVQFKVGGVDVGAPQTVSVGAASLPWTFNAAGSFEVTAVYSGVTGFEGSTSAPQSVTVTVPDVVTSLTLDVPATAVTGASVNLTAAVSPSGAQGAVQFTDGGTPIGAPVPVVNGVATLPYTFSGSGSHSIGASFTGGPGFADASATSPASIVVSDPDQQTTTAVTVPGTAQTGTVVTLEATVAPAPTGGTVQFKVDGNPVGAPQAVSGGAASLPWTFDAAGSFAVTAVFSGATGFEGSTSAPQSVTVSAPDVTTSLSVTAPATATTGESVDFSATVSPANAQGSVQFMIGGVAVGAPQTVSGGAASLPHIFNAAGSFAVTAEFSGAAGFTDSVASAQNVTVSVPDQQTSLTVEVPGSAATGSSVNLVANLTPPNAQGTVQFTDNGTPIGAPALVVNGVATLPHTFAAGSHSIGASFTGGPGFADASATVPGSIVVSDPDQQTSLSVTAPATATTGDSVDFSATVSPANAQGTVQFKIGGVAVGAPQTVSAGAASLSHTFNTAGTFAVTAEFTGAAGFTNSTAGAQTVTVTDPAPVDVATSTLVGAPGSATTGVETTLSVTVQAQTGTAVPTGSVQFRENGSPIGSPVTLVNGAASIGHTFTSVGTRQVSAVYTADAGFVGSTSVDRPVTVSAPNPSDVVSSVVIASTQAPTAGTPYVLKAQVIGAASLPGTVQFFDGGVAIGAPVPVVDGFAEITHTFTQSGPRLIHAVYSGGTGVAGSTSETQTLEVAQSGGGDTGGSLDFGSLGSLSGLRFGS